MERYKKANFNAKTMVINNQYRLNQPKKT